MPAEWISVPFFTAEWISIRFWEYNTISIHGWLIHSARHGWPAPRLVSMSLLGIYGGKGGPMDAWLKQVQMVRTFVTPLYEQQPATDQPRSTPATAGGPKPAMDQPRTYFRYKACLRRAAGDGVSYSVPLCLAAMFAPWSATCGGPTIVLHARLNVGKTISVL